MRLAGPCNGYSLLEALFVASLLGILAAIAIPSIWTSLDGARTRGAARYLAARLNLARMEAIKRSRYVAVRVEGQDTGYRYCFFADGNRDGVRTRDINRNIDQPIGAPERLNEKFANVTFGILDGVRSIDSSDPLEAGGDPVRFGQGDIVSFNPDGTATAGTFYIRGRKQQQMAVRVLGTTGRVRVLRFDFKTGRWSSQ